MGANLRHYHDQHVHSLHCCNSYIFGGVAECMCAAHYASVALFGEEIFILVLNECVVLDFGYIWS